LTVSPGLGREFLRFGLVGVVNTALDFCLFVLLYRWAGLEPLLANGLAFAVAVSNSYLMNHHWTFARSGGERSFLAYARFVVLNAGGLLLGTLAILVLGEYMLPELAKLVATLLTLVWNFTSSRHFVFKPRNP
jgi:putative flippase GtrA